ncbi:hypothetical protein BVG16_12505 [Paenibacillus selenitireducens]|uniref:MurNAc-LAA domain-containing protein n=1 Tax=Paenibacillus selenitireducens TaxID=1324314 RepID=A0A1T2XFJ5_9BACL|nr:hypothetical protein BVG16_12505 [Paenibacillus selenitireducens]
MLISIHGNTYKDPSVSGTETYYYHEDSLSLAEIMQKHRVQANGFRDRSARREKNIDGRSPIPDGQLHSGRNQGISEIKLRGEYDHEKNYYDNTHWGLYACLGGMW